MKAQTKWFRFGMKLWIILASLFAFLSGWILFGHSGKPVSTAQAEAPAQLAPLPTLAPLPSLNRQELSPFGNFESQSSFQMMPRLRTMGS